MMNSTVVTEGRESALKHRPTKILSPIAWMVVLLIGAYFVVDAIPRYLVWSEESYGFYWPRAGYLLPHLLGGLVAITIGPFQFWSHIRNNYPVIHRISGRVYLLSIAVAAVAALALSLTSPRGLAFNAGLFSLAFVWLLTSGMAFAAIRNRNFAQHKQWMIRSYVVTFAFVSFRIVADSMRYYGIGDPAQVSTMMAWACWSIPLLITELLLQSQSVFSGPRGRAN